MRKRYLCSLILAVGYLVSEKVKTDAMLKVILDNKFKPVNKHIAGLRNLDIVKSSNFSIKKSKSGNLPTSPLLRDTTILSNNTSDVIAYRNNNKQITIRVNKSSGLGAISNELTSIGNLLNEVTLSNNKN